CEVSKYSADERLQIFRRHMERVLLAVLGGDKEFILKNSKLLDAKNHIYYYYRKERYIFEEMGRVRDYIKESAE
ncbi:MAG TPA: staygreen family protein, partial [Tissierellaceae bacterium]|nr:staygreen family protein [Tissierellaceae bacterium]